MIHYSITNQLTQKLKKKKVQTNLIIFNPQSKHPLQMNTLNTWGWHLFTNNFNKFNIKRKLYNSIEYDRNAKDN
jgi:hypothetical protein